MTNLFYLLVITGPAITVGLFVFRALIRSSRKPILEIRLSPIDNPKWSDGQKIADFVDSFLRKGFESAGQYECWGMPSLIIAGFVKPSEQIGGVIYDHPAGGIWVDVYVQYTDGGSLTVTNAPVGDELDHMPQQTKVYCRERSVDELLEKVLVERRKEGRITITKEEFASHFEAHYQREMKWRIDRGGPTFLEIRRTANAMAVSRDGEELHTATQQIRNVWLEEKSKPRKIKRGHFDAILPEEFQRPEAFRLRMEQKSVPIPQPNLPVLPVYLILIAVLACWCYYGYEYNKTHSPVSFGAVIVFLSVLFALFLILMGFREYNRRLGMCPVLKRMADTRPGAFLVITDRVPTLFYARDGWIGKVSFREGGEHENARTRLDAITEHPRGSVEISRKSLFSKVMGGPDEETIALPESDFSRTFTVMSRDSEGAKRLLNHGIPDAIMRLNEFGKPFVEINRNSVGVEIESDLFNPRKEAVLRRFLEEAETIIESVAR